MTLTITSSFPHAGGPLTSSVKSFKNDETSILKRFLHGMGYYAPDISGTNEKLEAAMRNVMLERKIKCPQLEKTLHLAANLIELAFHECTFEEKKLIALYNWFIIYVDDKASKDVAAFSAFEQRFLRGLPQLEPVLTVFAEVIISLCEHYDTLTANAILTATFEFVNSNCMEPAIESVPLIRDAGRFPWYLRDQTGIGKAYALMAFPKTRKLPFTDYIQAVPDMNYWIATVNDFLSFHKEELAGEKGNYIHNRAYVEDSTSMQVLTDIGRELLEAQASIFAVLTKSPRAAETWWIFERGCIAWHLGQDRYKLKDLGL
ncbi:terpenoid synthase [Tricholoma matsutake]|nr:terpenoid synthase [Tricholoma matsutake 945]